MLSREALARAAVREICRRSFYDFVKLAWPHVEPGQYLDNWHVEVICQHAEHVSREHAELVCNVPPGCMKTLLVSVFWPAWHWATVDAGARFLFSSFDADLTRDSGRKVLDLVSSEWYREHFPHVLVPKDSAAGDFYTSAGGRRFATSTGGRLTGRHFDFAGIDDPVKPHALGPSATDPAAVETANRWFRDTLPSRGRNPKRFGKILIMQRVHEADPTAELVAGGWKHLRLPAEYEAANPCRTGIGTYGGDPRTEEGELLWPDRLPREVLEKLRKTMRRAHASQYQQRPSPESGDIFQRAWFQRYDAAPERFDQIVQSWDCAFKATAGSDFVCGQVWGRIGPRYYLLDQVHDRLSFAATVDAVKAMRAKWPAAMAILIEDKANGPAVVDALSKTVSGLVEVTPEGGKEARAHAISPLYESGCVFHPEILARPWIVGMEDELVSFPNARNDDRVDACTQALLHLYKASGYLSGMGDVNPLLNAFGWR